MRLLLLCCLALTTLASAADKPLNILFLFADDWGRYASIYAEHEKYPSPNQVVKTPNIDRIAREGALFQRAYVNAPSCTPCRSALLSGRYFFNCGQAAILNGAVWDPAIPSYPLLLKDKGYHLGKSFKVWGPGEPADAPYGGQAHAFQKSGPRCNQFSEEVTKMVAKGVELEAAKQQIYDEVRGNFDSFLAARPQGAPFVFWHGPTNVHRKWIKGSGQSLWGINPDDLLEQLKAGKGDGEILDWITATSTTKPADWQIASWSTYMEARGPSDVETKEYFTSLLASISKTREDIFTWADLLDLDDYASYGGAV